MPPVIITSLLALLISHLMPTSNIRLPHVSKLEAHVVMVDER